MARKKKHKNVYKHEDTTLLVYSDVNEARNAFKDAFQQAVYILLQNGELFTMHPTHDPYKISVDDTDLPSMAGRILADIISERVDSDPVKSEGALERICQLLTAYHRDSMYSEWDSWSDEWSSGLWEAYTSNYCWPNDLYTSAAVKEELYTKLAETLIETGYVGRNRRFDEEFFLNYNWIPYGFINGNPLIKNIWSAATTDEIIVEVYNED